MRAHAHTHMHAHTHVRTQCTAVGSALCAYMRVCDEVIVIAVRIIVRPLWCGIVLLYMHLQRYASLHVYMECVMSAQDTVTAILDSLAFLVVKVR